MKKKFKLGIFIICLLIVFVLLGGLGSLFTSRNTGSEWYQDIKPSLTPPNFVFPIVWNLLFLFISISLYLAWTSSKNKNQKKRVAIVFGINFVLNVLWSILFFGLKLTTLAFAELIFLWFSILAMILVVRKINKISAYLLVPYFVWVAFAGILNWLIAF